MYLPRERDYILPSFEHAWHCLLASSGTRLTSEPCHTDPTRVSYFLPLASGSRRSEFPLGRCPLGTIDVSCYTFQGYPAFVRGAAWAGDDMILAGRPRSGSE